LLALIDDKESESKTIDYKRNVVEKGDLERKEFLYDVSSFANTQGGFLVFGMEETGGLPTSLVGLDGINLDKERLRLEEMLKDGIRPPILGVEIVPVPLANGNVVIVMRIPRSWNPPHQVTYQKAFRFYARHSNGKYLLDVDELRSIFAVSGTLAERIRGFRADRLAKIAGGNAPVTLLDQGTLVMHLVPFSAFDAGNSFPIDKVALDPNRFPTFGETIAHHHQITFDGLLTTSNLDPPPRPQRAYVQVFRSGAVEVVTTTLAGSNGWMILPEIQAGIILSAHRYAHALHSFGIEPPIAVLVSLLNVKGKHLLQDFHFTGAFREELPSVKLAEDQFHFVETIFEVVPFDCKACARQLRATLDHLANAAGLATSPHFNDAGDYMLKV
jgi:hypothetical protein